MGTRPCSPGSAGPQPRDSGYERLEALVRDFDCNTRENRRLMRELLDGGRAVFCARAVEIIKREGDTPGSRCLIALLMANNLLLQALCHPGLTRNGGVMLANMAARVDPAVDMTIARLLAESGRRLAPAGAARAMEILAEIADGSGILSSMAPLLQHPNPHVRSKAVLLIGRGSRSPRWVQRRLAEQDPRVRANAVEGLWGVDSEEARKLLRAASDDSNNRVAGNALRGLYGLGDSTVFPLVRKMVGHESYFFRATAAWVMGETGDPRFTEVLAGMLRDESPVVRKRALSALAGIKTTAARVLRSNELRVGGIFSTDYGEPGLRRLRVTVISPGGTELDLLPTQFILAEDRHQIFDYTVAVHPVPGAMPVAFVLPGEAGCATAAWSDRALGSIGWKRPADQWITVPYNAAIQTTDPETNGAAPDDLWTALGRSARGEYGCGFGRRHIIILCQRYIDRSAGHDTISAVTNTAASIQAISTVENPALEDFCRRVQGSFRLAASEEELPNLIEQAHLRLLARYTITYRQAAAEARSLVLRVHSPAGWGRSVIAIPA